MSKVISTIKVTIVFIFVLVLFIPLDFATQNSDSILSDPSIEHLFGTDSLGRDLFARVVHGTRVTLVVSLVASLLTVFLAFLFSILKFFSSESTKSIYTRALDIVTAVPDLLLIIIISIIIANHIHFLNGFSKSLLTLVASISLTHWMGMSRMMEFQLEKISSTEFWHNSVLLGAKHSDLIFTHIIPHLKPVLLQLFITQIPLYIVYEGTLSFLGMGVNPPHTSLGILIKDGWSYININASLLIFPLIISAVYVFIVSNIKK